MYSGRSPTRRSSSATRSSRSRRLRMPWTSSGSPTRSSSVMRGLSEVNGSWKIICISRRSARSSAGRSLPTSTTEPSADPHEDLARGRLDRPQDAARGRGLAAAALPDQAQRLALVDVEVDAVHRADVAHRPLQEALPDRKELLQPGDPQEGVWWRRGSFVEEAAHRVAGRPPAAASAPPDRSGPAMNSGQRGWKGQPVGRS